MTNQQSSQNILVDHAATPDQVKKCQQVIRATTNVLRGKGFAWLLDCRIVFSNRRSEYHPERDTIYVDLRRLPDLESMAKDLIHEAGHRLQVKHFSVFKNLGLFFKYLNPKWGVNEYSRTNHQEMFAEFFRLWVLDGLDGAKEKWVSTIVRKFARP